MSDDPIINEHIREYNFAIPGAIDRHIPGIPGTWPFGSRAQVNEDTKQIVAVWPEGAAPVVPKPPEKPEKQEEQTEATPEQASAQPSAQ